MFFEFRVGADVMLVNLAQVTRIRVEPPSGELAAVTFYFTDGREETATLTATVLQRLNTALPRTMIYGAGGTG
jgi:hypothetical protein